MIYLEKRTTMISKDSKKSPAGDIELITISNASGASVVLTTAGAGVVAVNVPDSEGHLDDVALEIGRASCRERVLSHV